jgi:serine/threonine protein kinase
MNENDYYAQVGSYIDAGNAPRWQVVSTLGSGDSGQTYVVEDQNRLGVGIKSAKVFIPDYLRYQGPGELSTSARRADSKDDVEGHSKLVFEAESEALKQLDHPFIASIVNVGEVHANVRSGIAAHFRIGDRPVNYIVSDLVNGPNLRDFLTQADRHHVLAAIDSLAKALDYLHLQRMVHLDIKPSNVRVGEDGLATLIDFALSINVDSDQLNPEPVNAWVVKSQRVAQGDDEYLDTVGWVLNGVPPNLANKLLTGISRAEFSELCFPWLDYLEFGAIVNMAASRLEEIPTAPRDEVGYFRALSERLSSWATVHRFEPGSLSSIVSRVRVGDYLSGSPARYSGLQDLATDTPPADRWVATHPTVERLSAIRYPETTRLSTGRVMGTLKNLGDGAAALACDAVRALCRTAALRMDTSLESWTLLVRAAQLHGLAKHPVTDDVLAVKHSSFGRREALQVQLAFESEGAGSVGSVLERSGVELHRLERVLLNDCSNLELADEHLIHTVLYQPTGVLALASLGVVLRSSWARDVARTCLAMYDVAPRGCGGSEALHLAMNVDDLDVLEDVLSALRRAKQLVDEARDRGRVALASHVASLVAEIDGTRLAEIVRDAYLGPHLDVTGMGEAARDLGFDARTDLGWVGSPRLIASASELGPSRPKPGALPSETAAALFDHLGLGDGLSRHSSVFWYAGSQESRFQRPLGVRIGGSVSWVDGGENEEGPLRQVGRLVGQLAEPSVPAGVFASMAALSELSDAHHINVDSLRASGVLVPGIRATLDEVG